MSAWAWLAGFASGIITAAVLGILTVAFGYEFPEPLYWLTVIAITPVWPIAEYIPTSAAHVVRTVADAVRYVRPAKPAGAPTPVTPLQPARLTRLVPVAGGRRYAELPTVRSARWANWQVASQELAAWYAAISSLLVKDTVGRGRNFPFADGDARKLLLDEWDRLGLASNQNGFASELLVTPAELSLRLARGDIEWTDTHEPPAIRPAPREEVLMHRPTAESYAKG